MLYQVTSGPFAPENAISGKNTKFNFFYRVL